jgi:large subunit ribosomal protein L10
MDKSQKAIFIERFNSEVANAPFVVLTDFRGATVDETGTLRRQLEQHGLRLEVVKNTLARRAIEGTGLAPLAPHFTGMTSVIVSGEDPIAAAKVIRDVINPKGQIKVKAGFFEGTVLDAEGVKGVASLPGREELLVMLLQTMQAAPRQIMGVIRGPARDLLYLLKNYENKLADAGRDE